MRVDCIDKLLDMTDSGTVVVQYYKITLGESAKVLRTEDALKNVKVCAGIVWA